MSSKSKKQSDESRYRVSIADMGEYYYDMLMVEAKLKGRTLTAEANSLLCSNLAKRTEARQQMLNHLAWKRGISPEEVARRILTDTLEPPTPEEVEAFKSMGLSDDSQDI